MAEATVEQQEWWKEARLVVTMVVTVQAPMESTGLLWSHGIASAMSGSLTRRSESWGA